MNKAFTLVELALALIIIGLLIVTVLYAGEFRRAAEVRATIKQLLNYQMAYDSFKDRYEDLPGDFRRAYDFWPDNCDSEEFCNGDGNGLIDSYQEAHLSWLHLSNSRFITGSFAGEGYLNDETQVSGYNAPEGHLQGTQVSLVYFTLGEMPESHYFILGGYTDDNLGYTAVITPQHARSLDDKMDDGTPSGQLLGRNGYVDGDWDSASCLVDADDEHLANTDDLTDAIYYENQDESQECILALAVE